MDTDIKDKYNEMTAKIPLYTHKDLLSLPLLKINPMVSDIQYNSPEKSGVLKQIVMSKYSGGAFLPYTMFGSSVPTASEGLENLIGQKTPEIIDRQVSIERLRFPLEFIETYKKNAQGDLAFGFNPNPAVMGYLDMPKPYLPRIR